MQTLYDSDTYSVTHMLANAVVTDANGAVPVLNVPMLARHGFESRARPTPARPRP